MLPAGEVLLTVSSVGKEPKGLAMAVINDELPNWATTCAQEFNVSSTVISQLNGTDDLIECNFNELSCKYLNLVSQKGVIRMVL